MKPTCRKSWAKNLLMWSDWTLGPSFKVKRVCNMKPTYRRSWAGNLLMFSDLTLGPSFKVKRWFTGFGELSFQWIQICIGSPMCRSSYFIHSKDFTLLR